MGGDKESSSVSLSKLGSGLGERLPLGEIVESKRERASGDAGSQREWVLGRIMDVGGMRIGSFNISCEGL